ncbi:MAG TPA: aminotransferase class III-fold pyridoxal phosphate-dependent enzyme, partial [Bryobacteraceae bacterium]|nr:aminotransferase class III-fold pyridoxal phosphate-dependent enzyme [Bryobacteraceae bacterium]
ENAAHVGAYIISRMRDWPRRFGSVSEVRGLGLMIGIEMESAEARDRVVWQAFQKGVLVLGAGERTVRLSPPLVLTREQAECGISILEECVSQA